MKTIVLATDFSHNSRSAINYAMNLFGHLSVQFILLNTYYEPSAGAHVLVSMRKILHEDSQRRLKKEMEYFENKFPAQSKRMSVLSRYGDLQEILKSISNEIDLVVVGTKGMSAVKRVLLGSNTAQVLKKTRCRILVVPEMAQFKEPHHITIAMDKSKLSNLSGIKEVAQIAQHFNSRVVGVHVYPQDEVPSVEDSPESIQVMEAMGSVPMEFASIENDSVVEGLEDFVDQRDSDLLVMIAREHTWLDRLLHKSLSEKMALVLHLPMLILRDN